MMTTLVVQHLYQIVELHGTPKKAVLQPVPVHSASDYALNESIRTSLFEDQDVKESFGTNERRRGDEGMHRGGMEVQIQGEVVLLEGLYNE